METLSPATSGRSRRVQVRYTEVDWLHLSQMARDRDLPLTSLIRGLTRAAMASDMTARLDQMEVVAVASLMAAEHCLRLVEAVFPGAGRRSDEVGRSARVRALERVDEVRRDLEEARPA